MFTPLIIKVDFVEFLNSNQLNFYHLIQVKYITILQDSKRFVLKGFSFVYCFLSSLTWQFFYSNNISMVELIVLFQLNLIL